MSDTSLDLLDDDILDQTIDDLADFVPFSPFPVGDYKCQLTFEALTVGEQELPAIRAVFMLQEVLNLAQAGAEAPEEGRKISPPLYILRKKDGDKNTFAEGLLKRDILLPLQEVFGGTGLKEILTNGDGCSVIVTFGIRRRKDKETGEIREENTIKAMVVDQ